MRTKNIGNLNFVYRENTVDERQLDANHVDTYKYQFDIKENSTIIDIGAHIGTFSIISARKIKIGKIYAIEPCKGSYDLLEQNIKLNNCSEIVIPSHIAISDSKGKTKLFYDTKSGNWGNSITHCFSDKEFEEVNTDTLENFMVNNKISYCDFLKINCEGSEFKIILNSGEILRRIKKIVVLYHLDLVEYKSEIILKDYLEKYGFSTKVKITEIGRRGWIIAQR